jgi:hypothetical protein
VTVVAGKCDEYPETVWKAFAFGAAFTALFVVIADVLRPDWVTSALVFTSIVVVLAVGAASALAAVYVPAFARLFLRKSRAAVAVAQYANDQFMTRALFATPGRNALLVVVLDDRLDHPPVRLDAVGERIANHIHHALEKPIVGCRLGDAAGCQIVQVRTFRPGKDVDDIGGESRVRRQQVVLHHQGVVDRVESTLAQRRKPGIGGIRDQRFYVGRIDLDADGGGDLACDHEVLHLLSLPDRDDVGRRLVLFDMLVAG